MIVLEKEYGKVILPDPIMLEKGGYRIWGTRLRERLLYISILEFLRWNSFAKFSVMEVVFAKMISVQFMAIVRQQAK